MQDINPDNYKEFFKKAVTYKMPFGKYMGRKLIDLPEPYIVWFKQKGFPDNELGKLMEIVYEIKLNGLEYLFKSKQLNL